LILKILIFLILFLLLEISAYVAFIFIRKKFEISDTKKTISVSKGILERLLLCVGLVNEIYPILIFFGAIKIATRLDEKNKISNDYFLIGNIISVLFSILTSIMYTLIISEFGIL
jgi:hypothetical protein